MSGRQSVRTVIWPMFPRDTVSKVLLRLVLNFRRTGRRIYSQTVIHRLNLANLKACRPVVRPVLKMKHFRNRLHWATVHRNWQQRHLVLTPMMAEDLFGDQRGERYANYCVYKHNIFGGCLVMIGKA